MKLAPDAVQRSKLGAAGPSSVLPFQYCSQRQMLDKLGDTFFGCMGLSEASRGEDTDSTVASNLEDLPRMALSYSAAEQE